MFTGLIQAVGTVAEATRRSDALIFVVRPARLPGGAFVLGESIAHDGVCLTVTDVVGEGYRVLAGAETLARSTLGAIRVGTQVNLERALRMGEPLGGHWVTGHVDATAEVVSVRDHGANWVLQVRVPEAFRRYIVAKGSIALAGVSLTVNTVDETSFSVALIPHTKAHTTLGQLRPGAAVNFEVDLLAKHLEKLTAGYLPRPA